MLENSAQAARLLRADHELVSESLYLAMGGFCLGIRSNSATFIRTLGNYFAHVVTDACTTDCVVEAYDTDVLALDVDWQDWAREAGKSGKKDAFCDLDDGRLLLKVRTGMVFLQSVPFRIAAGPCSQLDNQVINFINSQYMNWLQQREWLICHAAGLDVDGIGLGIAGLSGGGKSTLMLGLMDQPDVRYVTNDRLFVRREDGQVKARGIPKLPRINPGTIVHNPALHGLIDASRRQELLALPEQELWHLEEKHDVIISEIYGENRIEEEMSLRGFLVLNWSHDSKQAMRLKEVDLESRKDLLPAIMKSPGPFMQFSDGSMYRDAESLDSQTYIEALRGVTILEASGRVDIPLLQRELEQWARDS